MREEETVPSVGAGLDECGLSLLDAVEQAAVATDAHGVVTRWNRAAERLSGWSAAEALGRSVAELLGLDPARVKRRLDAGAAWSAEAPIRAKDGRQVPVAFSVGPTPAEQGTAPGWIAIITDLSRRVEAELQLRDREEFFRRLFDYGPVAMLMLDLDLRITRVNGACTELLGYSECELIGRRAVELVEARDYRAIIGAAEAQKRGEIERDSREFPIRRGDGTAVEVRATGAALRDPGGEVTAFLVVAEDLTDRRQFEAELLHHARYDALTGLINRATITEELEHALSAADHFSLLLLGVDSLKDVNETLGHSVGDRVLATVAERLSEAVREQDRVGRFGGDEFAVIVRAAARPALRLAEQLLDALEAPVVIDGVAITVRATLGLVRAPDHGDDADTLLRRADAAMHRAKRVGSRLEAHIPADERAAARRLELAGGLPSAIAEDQLEVHYQPTIDFGIGGPGVVEALVRWRHPRYGLIPPLEFVPLASQYGLGSALFDAVLAKALADCRVWREEGLASMVGVNVAPATLLSPGFVGRVATALTAAELPAVALGLEVTEDAFAGDSSRLIEVLRQLSSVGVRLAIDDFGTGYSSLAMLSQLPVRTLKLDRVFCCGVESNPANSAIVASTVELAHRLGLRAVAEGIETPAAFDVVREHGYDAGQGYWIRRPIPSAELLPWLREKQRERTAGGLHRLPGSNRLSA